MKSGFVFFRRLKLKESALMVAYNFFHKTIPIEPSQRKVVYYKLSKINPSNQK